jgi:hypothetical protein
MTTQWMKQLMSMVVCSPLMLGGAPAELLQGTRCLTTGPGTGEQDMTDDNIVAQDTLSLNPSSGERNASPDEGRSYEVSS